jgi:hypothetical protein
MERERVSSMERVLHGTQNLEPKRVLQRVLLSMGTAEEPF